MKLADTVELMQSEDFKERFRAEYLQTRIRTEKLRDMIVKYKAGTLEFEPKCNLHILETQLHVMCLYLHVLEGRADVEGIDLYYV